MGHDISLHLQKNISILQYSMKILLLVFFYSAQHTGSFQLMTGHQQQQYYKNILYRNSFDGIHTVNTNFNNNNNNQNHNNVHSISKTLQMATIEDVNAIRSRNKLERLREGGLKPSDFEPKYKTRTADATTFNSQLSAVNRMNSDLIENLRSVYMKLRTLTEEEENTAGKFSQVGKRLESVKKDLTKKLNREPTDDEWSLSTSTSFLYMYK